MLSKQLLVTGPTLLFRVLKRPGMKDLFLPLDDQILIHLTTNLTGGYKIGSDASPYSI